MPSGFAHQKEKGGEKCAHGARVVAGDCVKEAAAVQELGLVHLFDVRRRADPTAAHVLVIIAVL